MYQLTRTVLVYSQLSAPPKQKNPSPLIKPSPGTFMARPLNTVLPHIRAVQSTITQSCSQGGNNKSPAKPSGRLVTGHIKNSHKSASSDTGHSLASSSSTVAHDDSLLEFLSSHESTIANSMRLNRIKSSFYHSISKVLYFSITIKHPYLLEKNIICIQRYELNNIMLTLP